MPPPEDARPGLTRLPRPRADLLMTPLDAERIVYDPATDTLHVLNPVAAAVWDGLAGARDAEALLAHCRLTLECLDGVELATEVRDTIAELDRAGLLDPPPLPEDPLAAGAVLLARRRFAEAAAVLDTPEALAGEAGRRAHALLGIARVAAGDLAGASATLLAGLARWPDDPALLNDLGGVHLLAGHPAEAGRAYERALEIDAGRAEVWSNLGSVRLRQGESDAAAACYQRALALDPFHAYALGPLVSLHLAAGRMAEAMRLLQEAAGRPAMSAALAVTVGRLYVEVGDLAAAEGVLRQGVASAPSSASVRNALGVVLARQGRRADARECFEAAARLDTRSTAGRFNLLQVDASEGHWGRVAESADALVPQAPDVPALRLLASRAYLAQGRAGDAERVLRDGLARNASGLPCAEALVRLLLERRRPLDAFLVYLEVASRLDDVDPARFPNLARLRKRPAAPPPLDGPLDAAG
jgi:Flp pilus assembly protein TadD